VAWVIKQNAWLLGLNVQGDLAGLTMYTSHLRRKRVVFDKAPPLVPATAAQLAQRQKFRDAGAAWQRLTTDQKDAFELATKRAWLKLTGFNLACWWYLTNQDAAIATIERQSGVTLTKPV
jgi:hypothetical protein